MLLTTYPANRVYGQWGNLFYRIKTSLYNTPMGRWHVSMLTQWHSVAHHWVASGLWSPLLRLWKLSFCPPVWTFARRPPSSFTPCKTWPIILTDIRRCFESWAPASGGCLRWPFAQRRRLTPNSSPSEVRFNPDEPNLRPPVSSLPKLSPPRVGVESKHVSLLLSSFAKRLARGIAVQLVTVIALAIVRSITIPGCIAVLRTGLPVLGHCPL
jgi:hypothetical protein